jgi:hypothetical protein
MQSVFTYWPLARYVGTQIMSKDCSELWEIGWLA